MGVQPLGQGDSLEKEMATHCSILAWEIPWTEEPGGLQSLGSQIQARLSAQAQTIFTIFTEFVTVSFLFCVLVFIFFLAARHMGSYLPNQGSNLDTLNWKANS